MPHGCAYDERWDGGAAGLWNRGDGNAYCRGLQSNLWLGASGTSVETHFDLSHNLFFLAAGQKTFRLLPPSAHHRLRLHPSWHGSHLAAQVRPTDAEFGALGGYEVTLRAGDVLYLPPGWFHHVRSDERNVGLNLWTHSLATDAWHHLNGDEARWDALLDDHPHCLVGGLATLFGCARACLVGLHAEMRRADGHVEGPLVSAETADGAEAEASLGQQSAALLTARYGSATAAGWSERLPSFGHPSAGAARARVAQTCAALTSDAPRVHAPLATLQARHVRGYAQALARFGDGLRSLLLDELVDDFSRYVVGPAAAALTEQQGLPLHLGEATVETFIRHCLAAQETSRAGT